MRNRSTLILAAAVIAIAAAARMPFWLAHTYAYGHGDAIIWEVWSRSIHEHGFINVFRTADSNNVGYHYVLWPTSVIYGLISPGYELWTPALRVLIKVPAFACDVGLAAIIFFAARALGRGLSPWRRDGAAALAALAFALSPATVYDSMWWSQIDSVITICMLGAVLLLARGNPGWAWALLAAGFLFKPQPVVIVPVLAAFTYWRFGVRGSARGAAGALAAASAALTPFVIHGDARLIARTYAKMFAPWEHDLAQGAWNGWSILDARGDPRPSDALLAAGGIDVTFMLLALALCVAVTLVALTYLRRNLDLPGLLLAASAMVFAFYMLPTSTHERYMYPMFALAAPLLVCAPRLVPGYAALAATFFLNLLAINPPSADPLWNLHGTDFAVVVAAVNVGIYAGFVGWMIIACLPHGWRLPAMVPRPAPLPAAAD